jgi:hypothetical protein
MFTPSADMFGWHDDQRAVQQVLAQMPDPLFATAAPHLVGDGRGKVALLYQYNRMTYGKDIILTQRRGTCVSKGWALGVDTLRAVQIASGTPEAFVNTCSSEVIYGGARVEIGHTHMPGDGAVGAWAAGWVTKYGIVLRGKHGEYDLTQEDDSIAVRFARSGVPATLQSLAKEHPVQTASLVRNYEEARDALANYQPVMVCSNQGFSSVRDGDGFARTKGIWPHCLCFIAVDDTFKRPGLLCMNSWGPNWNSGPKRHDQPDGSFWVDAEYCTRMLRGGDSFTIHGATGYPRQHPKHVMV